MADCCTTDGKKNAYDLAVIGADIALEQQAAAFGFLALFVFQEVLQ